MSNFTAIDFETATGDRASICQVGLVVVEQCKIIDRISHLVQPPGNIYSDRNIAVHGITPDKTKDAETFDMIWKKISDYLAGKKAVAHNAQFDISCLSAALAKYRLPIPKIEWYCTRKIYGSSLAVACNLHGIKYIPHDAVSDAEAAALLMIKDILR
jgi:DNA polymerase-3 subunit epsilon